MLFRCSFVIALLVVAGCNDGSPVGTRFDPTLLWARARWESSGIDSYAMTVRPLCFCGFVEPVRVTVRDGVVVSRIIVSTGNALPAQHASSYPDVPGLFAIIERAREQGADEIDTDFDESYGFPTGIWIDWKESWADDEIGYAVHGFSVEQ
jgi:Family of unknown function (DUF6174)